MKMKEKSDIKPVLVKVGLALALSFSSFIYSRFRLRRPNNPSIPFSDDRKIPTSNCVASFPSETQECDNDDRELFLLSEFDQFIKGLDSSPKAFVSMESNEHEEEIGHLKETVRRLRERERDLEDRLLEFHGLKEQESNVVELRNRLKLNTMEAKLFGLKVGSLRAENRRLEVRAAGKAKLVAELEAARAKIRLLKDKLRVEAERNKEQILSLKQRVAKFEEDEYESLASKSVAIRAKLKRARELEAEIEELRKSISTLQLENSDLTQKLESTQILASSVLEDPEADALRKENEDLKNEIEQLQADRCLEIEELVYLRWINACLRYELRHYKPADGSKKTVIARDLSKTLSPRSEEKAKQLIIEYANTEGLGEREIGFTDFDYDRWSSSHVSFTDSAEHDESSQDNSSAEKTNGSSSGRKRFFNKLMKLVRGKEHEPTVDGDSAEMFCGLSLDVPKSRSLKESRVSDLETRHRNSDVVVGSSCVYKTFVLGGESKDRTLKNSDHNDDRSELLKYAEGLRSSRRGSLKLHKKSASYGF